MVRLQGEDGSLAFAFKAAKKERVDTRKQGTIRYVINNELLYIRYVNKRTGESTKQLIVPTTLRRDIMTVAHDSMMAGHMGIARTTSRVITEFF